jgi:hypothetical protein
MGLMPHIKAVARIIASRVVPGAVAIDNLVNGAAVLHTDTAASSRSAARAIQRCTGTFVR